MLTVNFDSLGVTKGDLVLDAGCGFGRHSQEFMLRGARVLSMDMDTESLLKTRYLLGELRDSGHDTPFLAHKGDALRMPFKDNTFDRIICSEVMEHVDDEVQAARELVRILKPGGTIAVTVPTPFSEAIYWLLTVEYFTSPGGHVRIFTPKSLARILREQKLELYDIGFKHSFHTIWWMIRSVVGLHLNDHPLTKGYHRFLHLMLFSPFMRRMERFFDNFFPKSVVLYGRKPQGK